LSARVPERGILPVALPLMLLSMIAGSAFLFSRVLLNIEKEVAVAVAMMMAFNLLAFFAFMSSRIGRADKVEKVVALGVLLLPAVLGTAVAAGIIPTKGGEKEHGAEAAPAAVKLVAEDLKFDKDEITFPANTDVEVSLDNKDTAPHNVMVFKGPDDSGEKLNDGEPTADAGKKATYKLKSPEPGTYYFHCGIHPNMNGKVVVTEAKGGGEEGGGGTLSLSAKDSKFDKEQLEAKAGAKVTLNFENKESLPHNVQIFSTPETTGEPSVLKGEPAAMKAGKVKYEFTAPDKPGEYAFHCQFHPTTMKGKLVVE
jgi:plastocyanin